MNYCAFHIFSTAFKGPVWISEIKVCQLPPLPRLWRTPLDSTAVSQDVDTLRRQASWNIMAFTHSGGKHVRCILDF